MGTYKKAIITDAGESLRARAVAGKTSIQFSHAKTSAYSYPEGTDLTKLTDLQEIKQTVVPSNVQVNNDTLISVRSLFGNEQIAEEYLIQNVGLYATDGENEILFAVCQATMPDQMPVYDGVAPSSFIYNIQLTVSQASQIALTVNTAGTATTQDILELEQKKVDGSGGDISETLITTEEESKDEYPVPAAGDSTKTFLGKTRKFFTDIKNWMTGVCMLGQIVNNCVTDNPSLPLSAAQGKALMDLYTQLYSDLTRKYYSVNSQSSNPILEVYGNICVLQYCNVIWTSSDHIPSGFYPKMFIWTPVSSSDDINTANEYRLCITSDGNVVLQKNGTNVSDNTSIRGQAVWII